MNHSKILAGDNDSLLLTKGENRRTSKRQLHFGMNCLYTVRFGYQCFPSDGYNVMVLSVEVRIDQSVSSSRLGLRAVY